MYSLATVAERVNGWEHPRYVWEFTPNIFVMPLTEVLWMPMLSQQRCRGGACSWWEKHLTWMCHMRHGLHLEVQLSTQQRKLYWSRIILIIRKAFDLKMLLLYLGGVWMLSMPEWHWLDGVYPISFFIFLFFESKVKWYRWSNSLRDCAVQWLTARQGKRTNYTFFLTDNRYTVHKE